MKKITLTITLLLAVAYTFAQTTSILSEDFETDLGDFTTEAGVDSTGSTSDNPQTIWHYNADANGRAFINWKATFTDEYLVSPAISIPTSSVAFLEWKWDASYYWSVDPNANGNIKVLVSTDDGETWTTLWQMNNQSDVENSGVTWPFVNFEENTSRIDVSAYEGQDIKLAFEYVATDSATASIREMEVFTIDNANDLKLDRINVNAYFEMGSQEIGGRIVNNGSEEIVSYDVTYNVDGGTESAVYSVSGSAIAFGQTHSFTHDVPFNFDSVGQKVINVTISNVNGATDADTSNNAGGRTVSVASQTALNTPFFESFTSSTCAPCAPFNEHVASFTDSHDDVAIVKYQVSWPAPGDPYNTEEVGVRRGYYGVNSVPSFIRGGRAYVNTGSAAAANLITAYDTEIALPSFVSPITGHFSVDGSTVTVYTSMTPYVTGDFKIHIAVVEKETTENVGNNGETSFDFVMMKMLPDAEGTTYNFVDGEVASLSFSHDMSTTFVEDMSDLAVVVFVQDNATGYIMQSKMVTMANAAGVNDTIFESVSLFPNPSQGVLNIKTDKELSLSITDLLGKKVLSRATVSNLDRIDISHLNNGVYFVKVSDGISEGIQKIVLTK